MRRRPPHSWGVRGTLVLRFRPVFRPAIPCRWNILATIRIFLRRATTFQQNRTSMSVDSSPHHARHTPINPPTTIKRLMSHLPHQGISIVQPDTSNTPLPRLSLLRHTSPGSSPSSRSPAGHPNHAPTSALQNCVSQRLQRMFTWV
jgi:hypothetical protein